MNTKNLVLGISTITLFLLTGCSRSNTLCTGSDCKTKKESTVNNQPLTALPIINLDSDEEPRLLVCLITGPELAERKEALKQEIFSKVNEIKEVDKGYIFTFDDTDGFLLKLTDYIIVEKACCPFFNYDFSVLPYEKGISLTISGQEGVKSMIETFVEEIRK